MTRATSTALALLLLVAASLPVAASEPDRPKSGAVATSAGEVVPGEVVVKWRDASRSTALAASRGLAAIVELGVPGSGLPALASTNGRPVDEVLAELRADPAVEYAEPNFIIQLATDTVQTAVAVNDPKTGPQYSLDRMRVRDAWSLSTGASRIVAVLDTGVDFGHPDLAGRMMPGHDFVNNDADASDDNGHGTWVSGIIAANANDGIGIAGISWSDQILPVKIMDQGGSGDTADLTAGIIWAADQGAHIINMSVGGFPSSQYVHDAVRYAWDRGVVLVGAAGNNATEGAFYPASFPEVVSVSATQVDDEFSNWSNYGADVDVSAPGASVLTTNCPVCKPIEQDISGDHRYTYISGTSFAAPNVAGVVALIWARYPSMTNAQVVDRLLTTVDDLGYGGWDARYGHGRVNALRAVGGNPATLALTGLDNLESNDTLAAARPIALDSTIRPNIYPAGDIDVFAVDAPRAGRIDITAVPVIDTRAFPWHRSSLAIDVVVDVYRTDGTHLLNVDQVDPSATDRGSVQLYEAGRLLLRVRNYTPNGNQRAYALTTTFVDNVGFLDTGDNPFSAEIDWLAAEGITQGCSPERFCPKAPVSREQMASFVVRANGLPPTTTDFFTDDGGSAHQADINSLAAAGVTDGCGSGRYCPSTTVTREQMASFLVRALGLPPTTTDFFTDDGSSAHQADINSLAAAGVTDGCGSGRYCPTATLTREQMAAFLYRAFSPLR